MDRFTPADTAYDFSRADVNDIIIPILIDIIGQIKDQCLKAFTKYHPTKIVLTGGGAEIEGLRDFIENAFTKGETKVHYRDVDYYLYTRNRTRTLSLARREEDLDEDPFAEQEILY